MNTKSFISLPSSMGSSGLFIPNYTQNQLILSFLIKNYCLIVREFDIDNLSDQQFDGATFI